MKVLVAAASRAPRRRSDAVIGPAPQAGHV